MGLGRSDLSLPSQLRAGDAVPYDSFSHCLAGDGGGRLAFGRSAASRVESRVPLGTDAV